jgi:energy-coupling factor transport system permease protein
MLVYFILRLTVKAPFNGARYIKNLSMLVIFMILLQTLLGPGENYIVKPLFPPSFPLFGGMGSLKWDGFKLGLLIACRLSALLVLLPILTLTTSPRQIATALCAFRINYRSAFVITTAFNLIPLFEEEARLIMDAQKLRGAGVFEKRSFFSKLKAYPGLVVPLVLGAMRKAQSAGIAMDSRAFGVYRTRTWLDKPSMKARDFLAVTFCAVFCAAVLLLNFLKF